MNKITLFVFMAVFAISCKKTEKEEDIPEEPYLSKVYTTTDGVVDSVLYEYNSKNELSKVVFNKDSLVKLEYYESGDLAIADTYYIIHGDKPQKVREYLMLTYDDDYKLESGVLKHYVNSILMYTANIEYVINDLDQVEQYVSDVPQIPGKIITYTDNGNIQSIKDYSDYSIISYEYNEKKNILNKSRLKYYIGAHSIPVEIFNNNDILKSELYRGPIYKVENYDTTYDGENTPISSTVEVIDSGNSFEQLREYEYSLRSEKFAK
ncbi:MAG: hypothetical protein ACO1N7_10750 [Sphingobacteriaceae bacterium]